MRTLAGIAIASAGVAAGSARAAGDGPRAGDWLVQVDDDGKTPLGVADLKAGEKQVVAWPYDPVSKTLRDGTRLNRILLIKLDAAAMDGATRPLSADGVLAYSAFCTHQGCDVNTWLPKEQALLCYCHFSKFAPLQGGAVLDGPAPRALPALPLRAEDGKLVVAGGFNSEPGKAA